MLRAPVYTDDGISVGLTSPYGEMLPDGYLRLIVQKSRFSMKWFMAVSIERQILIEPVFSSLNQR